MDKKKICIGIIIICIVAPILVGYVYPQDYRDVTSYSVDSETNLSNNLFNDEIPGTMLYSGTYNNQFYGSTDLLNNEVNGTAASGPWPLTEMGEQKENQYILDKDGTVNSSEISYVISQITEQEPDTYYVRLAPDTGYSITYMGEEVTAVYIFTSTSQVFVLDAMRSVKNITGQTFSFTGPTVSHEGSNWLSLPFDYFLVQKDASGNTIYADVSSGTEVVNTNVWYNTYENRAISIILDLSAVSTTGYVGFNFYASDHSAGAGQVIPPLGSLSVNVSSAGEITVTARDSDGIAHGANSQIGRVSVYPYILLEFDTDSDTVVVTGLVGMSKITDITSATRGNSVTIEGCVSSAFSSMVASTQSGTPTVRMYVSQTLVEYGTTPIMNSVSIDPQGYYPDAWWGLSFRSTAISGSSIILHTSTGDITLPVVKGQIDLTPLGDAFKFLGNNSDGSIAVGQFALQYVPDADGNAVMRIQNIAVDFEVESLTLTGLWNTVPTLTVFESSTSKEFIWDAGGFGLDQTGFCIVGLFTAFGMLAVVALSEKRRNDTIGWATLVAGICGVVYLVLLFQMV